MNVSNLSVIANATLEDVQIAKELFQVLREMRASTMSSHAEFPKWEARIRDCVERLRQNIDRTCEGGSALAGQSRRVF